MNARSIGYWAATLIVAFCIGSGGIAELMQVPMVIGGMEGLYRA